MNVASVNRDNPVQPIPADKARLPFVDGLRGLAALSVATMHIYQTSSVVPFMPRVIDRVLDHGYLGVAVFFVLSGFVISYALNDTLISPGTFARFIGRRSLRLDPPYFASIGLGLLAIAFSNFLLTDRVLEFPSLGAIVAHLFYLEDILGVPKIYDIYWTLCLEIQFYLLFALLFGIAQHLARQVAASAVRHVLLLMFAPIFIYGFSVATGFNAAPRGSCFGMWHMFFGGVLTCWLLRGKVSFAAWLIYIFLMGFIGIFSRDDMTALALLTMIGIGLAWRYPVCGAWLGGRSLQYLGRISYSLYLTHPIFGQRMANFGIRISGQSNWSAWVWFFLAIGFAIVAAGIFWHLIEAPAIRWSRRIRLQRTEMAPITV